MQARACVRAAGVRVCARAADASDAASASNKLGRGDDDGRSVGLGRSIHCCPTRVATGSSSSSSRVRTIHPPPLIRRGNDSQRGGAGTAAVAWGKAQSGRTSAGPNDGSDM